MAEYKVSDEVLEAFKDAGVNLDLDDDNKDVEINLDDEKVEETKEAVEEPVKEEPKETVGYEETEKEERKFTDEEKAAMEKGWKPDGPKSAEEFMRAEPLYEEIKARGKEIKELKATVDKLGQHLTKQQEVGYKKALDDLQAQRTDAIYRGDVNQVDKLDAEIGQIKTEVEQTNTETNHPAVEDFFSRHKNWIQDPSYSSQKMRDFATQRYEALEAYNLPMEERMRIVEKDIRGEFPDRFENVERERPPAVESANRTVSKSKSRTVSFKHLNSEQRMIYRHVENSNGTEQAKAYIKQLVEMGEIKTDE